ncbi:MAG: acetate kinase, partial [Edaphobacter sp.]
SVVRQMREAGGVPRRMAIAHLGSGCSVTAVVEGRSVDTTMGLTPTGGVVMGTRPGDLDPGLVLYLLRLEREQKAGSREQGARNSDSMNLVERMLNRESGMVALSGLPNDMKAVREAAAKGDARARLAVEVFVRSVRKVAGGFAWLMGGLDAIAFTGGIGEHDAASRVEILAGLDGLGVAMNSAANSAAGEALRRIDASESKAAIFVVPAQEDRMIALHVARMARSGE